MIFCLALSHCGCDQGGPAWHQLSLTPWPDPGPGSGGAAVTAVAAVAAVAAVSAVSHPSLPFLRLSLSVRGEAGPERPGRPCSPASCSERTGLVRAGSSPVTPPVRCHRLSGGRRCRTAPDQESGSKHHQLSRTVSELQPLQTDGDGGQSDPDWLHRNRGPSWTNNLLLVETSNQDGEIEQLRAYHHT